MTGTPLKSNKVLNSLITFDTLDSTNQFLKSNNFAAGTVVRAAVQTAGRGKHGAKWSSGSGGLWFSFVINKKVKRPYDYVILSSVAVCEALRAIKVNAIVKWPNDILVEGRKICGMLIENDYFSGRLITGIGINVNNTVPKDAAAKAVSLRAIKGRKVDLEKFFPDILSRIDRYLSAIPANKKQMIAKWVKLQGNIKGKEIKLQKKGKTEILVVVNVLRSGAVKVNDSKGRTRVLKGEVFFVG